MLESTGIVNNFIEKIEKIDKQYTAINQEAKHEYAGYFELPAVSTLKTFIKLSTTAITLPGEIKLVDEKAQILLTALTTLLPMAQDMEAYNQKKDFLVDGGKKLKEQGIIYRDAIIAVTEASEQFYGALENYHLQQKKDRLASYSKDSIQYQSLKINLAAQALLDATRIVDTPPIDIPAFDSAVTQFTAEVEIYSDFLKAQDPDGRKFSTDCRKTQATYNEMIGSARSLASSIRTSTTDTRYAISINYDKEKIFSHYNTLSNGYNLCLF